MAKHAQARPLTSGTIEEKAISAAREKMYELTHQFISIQDRINQTSEMVKANWVGKGRNEFENQYNLLIAKIGELSDSLDEMYEALVDAETEYREVDNALRQEMVMGT